MTNINERIGYEMRSQRLLKRMTLAQMADRLGKSSRNTISLVQTAGSQRHKHHAQGIFPSAPQNRRRDGVHDHKSP